MPDNGISVERREAQGFARGPCVSHQTHRPPAAHRRSKETSSEGLRAPPGAPLPSFEGKKGNRETGAPGVRKQSPARRSLTQNQSQGCFRDAICLSDFTAIASSASAIQIGPVGWEGNMADTIDGNYDYIIVGAG